MSRKYERVGLNLYKRDGKYYRLFATSVTPNGCWLINPAMRELLDIDTATGRDIYGFTISLGDGTVPASHPYQSYCPQEAK